MERISTGEFLRLFFVLDTVMLAQNYFQPKESRSSATATSIVSGLGVVAGGLVGVFTFIPNAGRNFLISVLAAIRGVFLSSIIVMILLAVGTLVVRLDRIVGGLDKYALLLQLGFAVCF